jgi:creatinine amidohydrolase
VGLRTLLDYIVELHNDIMARFPPGKLPPIEQITQRRRDDIEEVVKGPLNGGKHIYSLAYPP